MRYNDCNVNSHLETVSSSPEESKYWKSSELELLTHTQEQQAQLLHMAKEKEGSDTSFVF